MPILILSFLSLLQGGCAATGPGDYRGTARPGPMRIAHLDRPGTPGLSVIRSEFAQRNPGYALEVLLDVESVEASGAARIAFVQGGVGYAAPDERLAGVRVSGPGRAAFDIWESDVTIGDIVLLHPGAVLACDAPIDLLLFTVPGAGAPDLPRFIRPDWDPGITDTPGGCATETGAYRRILLTWLPERGPYIFHGLNCHRVRVTDSFTHYHPLAGGFDEFYLVQMVQPGGRIITSRDTQLIEQLGSDTGPGCPGVSDQLLQSLDLEVGDLVYLPRGLAHRGVGGVLAQVIAVPGFRPGAEIGLDHYLKAINGRFGLTGDRALPFHAAAASAPVVK